MRAFSIAAAVVLAVAATASAGPLVPQRVAADAKWVVHVDFDALRSAPIVEKLSQPWLNRDSTKRQLEKVREILGTDPLTALHGVTFYGTSLAGSGYVVVLDAKVDPQRLLAFVRRMPDYRTETYGDRELHAWTHTGGRRGKQSVTACFAGDNLTVVAGDAADVKRALDVLDGKSPALPTDSPLAAEVPSGTAFRGAALGLAEARLPFRSPLVRQSERIAVAAGEHEGEAFAEGTIVARSPEVAQQLRAIIEGFRATAALQFGNDARAAAAFQRLKVTVQENEVHVQWRVPNEDLLGLIERARSNMKQSQPRE